MNSVQDKPKFSPLLVLTIGVFAISFSSIFIRWAQDEAVPSLVIAAWRTGLAGIILLPIALRKKGDELRALPARGRWMALLSGVLLGLHFGSWISSLEYTSITSSTVLVATSPLWVGLASPFVLKESLSRGIKAGIALAIFGSLIIGLGDVAGWENGRLFLIPVAGSHALLGNGLALVGAFAAAGYLLLGRLLRPSLSLLSYTAVVYSTAAVTLIAASLWQRYPLFDYAPQVYLLFGLMALFPQLIGHSSFNWALGYLPAAYVSVAVISEPIGASILAVLIFQELPGAAGMIGSLFILVGILVSSRK